MRGFFREAHTAPPPLIMRLRRASRQRLATVVVFGRVVEPGQDSDGQPVRRLFFRSLRRPSARACGRFDRREAAQTRARSPGSRAGFRPRVGSTGCAWSSARMRLRSPAWPPIRRRLRSWRRSGPQATRRISARSGSTVRIPIRLFSLPGFGSARARAARAGREAALMGSQRRSPAQGGVRRRSPPR